MRNDGENSRVEKTVDGRRGKDQKEMWPSVEKTGETNTEGIKTNGGNDLWGIDRGKHTY